jgi:lipid-A-disaccharide synthase
MCDLFILAAEPSADLHGARLAEELLKLRPGIKICALAGPRMRKLPIQADFPMESLQVMGFVDVVAKLPIIARQFFALRKRILALQPKAVVCIDYPGFNLRLERSLRRKGYKGKLIHYICPTVWAWGKKRIPLMAETLDLLLVLFPFEKECFKNTPLSIECVGHPLIQAIAPNEKRERAQLLGLFPGSRENEIKRNFPLQLAAAQRLKLLDPSIEIAVSISHPEREAQIRRIAGSFPLRFVAPEKNYDLMRRCRLALATSGTVTLELALHNTPTVVNFAIRPLDVFLAQKIFRIDLPFYCIVNIIASRGIFPELFGPNLTEEALANEALALWFDEEKRAACQKGCEEARSLLGEGDASARAAQQIASIL